MTPDQYRSAGKEFTDIGLSQWQTERGKNLIRIGELCGLLACQIPDDMREDFEAELRERHAKIAACVAQ